MVMLSSVILSFLYTVAGSSPSPTPKLAAGSNEDPEDQTGLIIVLVCIFMVPFVPGCYVFFKRNHAKPHEGEMEGVAPGMRAAKPKGRANPRKV